MTCRNCGKCCWYNLDGKDKLCKYIRINNDNTTFCTIYSERIGKEIDREVLDYNYNGSGNKLVKKIICGHRKDEGYNRYISGCMELNMIDNPKIVIGISVFNSVHPTFLKALENSRHEWKIKNYFCEVLYDDHVPLDYSRNIIVQNAIHANADRIFFLDSDIILPKGALTKLLEQDKDIITGIYYWKFEPYYPIVMKNHKNNDGIGYTPIFNFKYLNNPLEIDSTGFGCCLVKTEVFKHIPYPWFTNDPEPNKMEGDLNFCKRLQKSSYKIYADNTVLCGHYGIILTDDIRTNSRAYIGGSLPEGEKPVELIEYLVDKFKPKTVLDVGCGPFGAMKIFNTLDNNIKTYGLDGDSALLNRDDCNGFTLCDLEKSSFIYPNKFDMIFSYEVAEHIANVDNYIDTLTENCDNILVMTHAIPGQAGYHHVNCQEDEYWDSKITAKGFTFLEKETMEARTIGDKYFKQSGLIFKCQ